MTHRHGERGETAINKTLVMFGLKWLIYFVVISYRAFGAPKNIGAMR